MVAFHNKVSTFLGKHARRDVVAPPSNQTDDETVISEGRRAKPMSQEQMAHSQLVKSVVDPTIVSTPKPGVSHQSQSTPTDAAAAGSTDEPKLYFPRPPAMAIRSSHRAIDPRLKRIIEATAAATAEAARSRRHLTPRYTVVDPTTTPITEQDRQQQQQFQTPLAAAAAEAPSEAPMLASEAASQQTENVYFGDQPVLPYARAPTPVLSAAVRAVAKSLPDARVSESVAQAALSLDQSLALSDSEPRIHELHAASKSLLNLCENIVQLQQEALSMSLPEPIQGPAPKEARSHIAAAITSATSVSVTTTTNTTTAQDAATEEHSQPHLSSVEPNVGHATEPVVDVVAVVDDPSADTQQPHLENRNNTATPDTQEPLPEETGHVASATSTPRKSLTPRVGEHPGHEKILTPRGKRSIFSARAPFMPMISDVPSSVSPMTPSLSASPFMVTAPSESVSPVEQTMLGDPGEEKQEAVSLRLDRARESEPQSETHEILVARHEAQPQEASKQEHQQHQLDQSQQPQLVRNRKPPVLVVDEASTVGFSSSTEGLPHRALDVDLHQPEPKQQPTLLLSVLETIDDDSSEDDNQNVPDDDDSATIPGPTAQSRPHHNAAATLGCNDNTTGLTSTALGDGHINASMVTTDGALQHASVAASTNEFHFVNLSSPRRVELPSDFSPRSTPELSRPGSSLRMSPPQHGEIRAADPRSPKRLSVASPRGSLIGLTQGALVVSSSRRSVVVRAPSRSDVNDGRSTPMLHGERRDASSPRQHEDQPTRAHVTASPRPLLSLESVPQIEPTELQWPSQAPLDDSAPVERQESLQPGRDTPTKPKSAATTDQLPSFSRLSSQDTPALLKTTSVPFGSSPGSHRRAKSYAAGSLDRAELEEKRARIVATAVVDALTPQMKAVGARKLIADDAPDISAARILVLETAYGVARDSLLGKLGHATALPDALEGDEVSGNPDVASLSTIKRPDLDRVVEEQEDGDSRVPKRVVFSDTVQNLGLVESRSEGLHSAPSEDSDDGESEASVKKRMNIAMQLALEAATDELEMVAPSDSLHTPDNQTVPSIEGEPDVQISKSQRTSIMSQPLSIDLSLIQQDGDDSRALKDRMPDEPLIHAPLALGLDSVPSSPNTGSEATTDNRSPVSQTSSMAFQPPSSPSGRIRFSRRSIISPSAAKSLLAPFEGIEDVLNESGADLSFTKADERLDSHPKLASQSSVKIRPGGSQIAIHPAFASNRRSSTVMGAPSLDRKVSIIAGARGDQASTSSTRTQDLNPAERPQLESAQVAVQEAKQVSERLQSEQATSECALLPPADDPKHDQTQTPNELPTEATILTTTEAPIGPASRPDMIGDTLPLDQEVEGAQTAFELLAQSTSAKVTPEVLHPFAPKLALRDKLFRDAQAKEKSAGGGGGADQRNGPDAPHAPTRSHRRGISSVFSTEGLSRVRPKPVATVPVSGLLRGLKRIPRRRRASTLMDLLMTNPDLIARSEGLSPEVATSETLGSEKAETKPSEISGPTTATPAHGSLKKRRGSTVISTRIRLSARDQISLFDPRSNESAAHAISTVVSGPVMRFSQTPLHVLAEVSYKAKQRRKEQLQLEKQKLEQAQLLRSYREQQLQKLQQQRELGPLAEFITQDGARSSNSVNQAPTLAASSPSGSASIDAILDQIGLDGLVGYGSASEPTSVLEPAMGLSLLDASLNMSLLNDPSLSANVKKVLARYVRKKRKSIQTALTKLQAATQKDSVTNPPGAVSAAGQQGSDAHRKTSLSDLEERDDAADLTSSVAGTSNRSTPVHSRSSTPAPEGPSTPRAPKMPGFIRAGSITSMTSAGKGAYYLIPPDATILPPDLPLCAMISPPTAIMQKHKRFIKQGVYGVLTRDNPVQQSSDTVSQSAEATGSATALTDLPTPQTPKVLSPRSSRPSHARSISFGGVMASPFRPDSPTTSIEHPGGFSLESPTAGPSSRGVSRPTRRSPLGSPGAEESLTSPKPASVDWGPVSAELDNLIKDVKTYIDKKWLASEERHHDAVAAIPPPVSEIRSLAELDDPSIPKQKRVARLLAERARIEAQQQAQQQNQRTELPTDEQQGVKFSELWSMIEEESKRLRRVRRKQRQRQPMSMNRDFRLATQTAFESSEQPLPLHFALRIYRHKGWFSRNLANARRQLKQARARKLKAAMRKRIASAFPLLEKAGELTPVLDAEGTTTNAGDAMMPTHVAPQSEERLKSRVDAPVTASIASVLPKVEDEPDTKPQAGLSTQVTTEGYERHIMKVLQSDINAEKRAQDVAREERAAELEYWSAVARSRPLTLCEQRRQAALTLESQAAAEGHPLVELMFGRAQREPTTAESTPRLLTKRAQLEPLQVASTSSKHLLARPKPERRKNRTSGVPSNVPRANQANQRLPISISEASTSFITAVAKSPDEVAKVNKVLAPKLLQLQLYATSRPDLGASAAKAEAVRIYSSLVQEQKDTKGEDRPAASLPTIPLISTSSGSNQDQSVASSEAVATSSGRVPDHLPEIHSARSTTAAGSSTVVGERSQADNMLHSGALKDLAHCLPAANRRIHLHRIGVIESARDPEMLAKLDKASQFVHTGAANLSRLHSKRINERIRANRSDWSLLTEQIEVQELSLVVAQDVARATAEAAANQALVHESIEVDRITRALAARAKFVLAVRQVIANIRLDKLRKAHSAIQRTLLDKTVEHVAASPAPRLPH